MQEIIPGILQWTAIHLNIHSEVSSYWLDDGGVLIDPLVPPEEGLEWFAERPTPPSAILLANRHDYRESGRFAERFGCTVHCNRRVDDPPATKGSILECCSRLLAAM